MRASHTKLRVAVIGSGPAGLMAAFQLAKAGLEVHVFEKRTGPGRKLLVAGSSGLNVTFDAPIQEFCSNYTGPRAHWNKFLTDFSPRHWLDFIEELGLETFLGTSRRYFVKEMKASRLLKAWVERLKTLGVEFHFGEEVSGFEVTSSGQTQLQLKDYLETFSAVCFCLGGGSWEQAEIPLRWPKLFTEKGLKFEPFRASNCGFKVAWPEALLKEAEGLPLKGVTLSTKKGERQGELVITNYGIEGTPVYAIGTEGKAFIDLKPDLTEKGILKKVEHSHENLAPMRRVKKYLKLPPATLALLFHLTTPAERGSLKTLVSLIKHFPLELKERQPLAEAISSSGGLSWSELTPDLMLKTFPGFFAAGEMLDWDAPTGGFLIQGCVSQGAFAGRAILKYLRSRGD